MTDLSRITANVQSPEWWFTAIVAGLLMSVIGAYLKQGLDRLLGLSSRRWRELRAWQKQARTLRVVQASEDAHFFLALVASEMRVRFRLVCYLVGAVGLFMFLLAFTFAGMKASEDFMFYHLPGLLLVAAGIELWTLLYVRTQIWEAERLRQQRHSHHETTT